MHKGRHIQNCLPQRALWAQLHGWTAGSIPESKAGLENRFLGMRIETFFCINATLQHLICLAELPHLKAPRMQSIFLIWVELKRKACRPDPRVTTLKSRCGQQPVEWRSCHRERLTHCGCLHVCLWVFLFADQSRTPGSDSGSEVWSIWSLTPSQRETSVGGTQSTRLDGKERQVH